MTVYTEQSVREYVGHTAAREPVPGGGSVAALAGALGAALTSMVCNFTVGNPKFAAVEPQVKSILGRAEELRAELLCLVDKDTEVYAEVTAAYKLPRATDEQKAARQNAIQAALKSAAAVPLAIGRAARDVSRLTSELVDLGNPALVSDVGVAVLLAEAALRGAALNVEINASAIKDREFASGLQSFLGEALPEVAATSAAVMVKTMNQIKGGAG
jgi:formiminotetrahydrofolate cyclodeaminase